MPRLFPCPTCAFTILITSTSKRARARRFYLQLLRPGSGHDALDLVVVEAENLQLLQRGEAAERGEAVVFEVDTVEKSWLKNGN